MTLDQIEARNAELFAHWAPELLHQEAVPLVVVAGVTGITGPLQTGAIFTINSQGKSAREVIQLLRNTANGMEALLP